MTTSKTAPRWLRRQINRGARFHGSSSPEERLWAAYDWARAAILRRPDPEQDAARDEAAEWLAGFAARMDGVDSPNGGIRHARHA